MNCPFCLTGTKVYNKEDKVWRCDNCQMKGNNTSRNESPKKKTQPSLKATKDANPCYDALKQEDADYLKLVKPELKYYDLIKGFQVAQEKSQDNLTKGFSGLLFNKIALEIDKEIINELENIAAEQHKKQGDNLKGLKKDSHKNVKSQLITNAKYIESYFHGLNIEDKDFLYSGYAELNSLPLVECAFLFETDDHLRNSVEHSIQDPCNLCGIVTLDSKIVDYFSYDPSSASLIVVPFANSEFHVKSIDFDEYELQMTWNKPLLDDYIDIQVYVPSVASIGNAAKKNKLKTTPKKAGKKTCFTWNVLVSWSVDDAKKRTFDIVVITDVPDKETAISKAFDVVSSTPEFIYDAAHSLINLDYEVQPPKVAYI